MRIASVIQAAGLISLTAAGFLVSAPVGFLAAGGSLVLAGIAVEVTDARKSDSQPSD